MRDLAYVVIRYGTGVIVNFPLLDGIQLKTMFIATEIIWFNGAEREGRFINRYDRRVLVAPEKSVL